MPRKKSTPAVMPPAPGPTGWIPPFARDDDQHQHHEAAMAMAMPRFSLEGTYHETTGRFELFKAVQKVLRPSDPQILPYNWQVTGSCFPAGTPVRMADGSEKPIEEVRVGDEVITHTGMSRRVVETMRRDYTGDLLTLHVKGFAFPLTMTADHRVAVVETAGRVTARREGERLRHSLTWVRADELSEGDGAVVGCVLREEDAEIDLLPLLGDRGVDMDSLAAGGSEDHGPYSRARAVRAREDIRSGSCAGRIRLRHSRYENAIFRRVAVSASFARFIGLYLAEGGVHDGRVTFTYSAQERDTLAAETLVLARGLFGAEGELLHEPGRGRTTVRFNNLTLAAALKALVPGDVYTKRVPGAFFNAPAPVRAALIGGWYAGDGYYQAGDDRRDGKIQGVTASAGLARDVTTLALSVGHRASCSRRKPRGRSREAWDVYLSGESARIAIAAAKGCQADTVTRRAAGDTNFCPFGYVRAVKRVDRIAVVNLPVYDFEVEEDHSFLAGGLVVHNCVGAGGGNMLRTLMCVEIAAGEAEEYQELFWLFTYGRSRYHAGMPNPGEGSFGSAWAKAIKEDGCLHLKEAPGLPQPALKSGWIQFTASVERTYSDGDAKVNLDLMPTARLHPVKSFARIRSADEGKAAIANGYPLTQASMFGTSGAKRQGSPAVMVAEWDGSWAHQMWFDSCWDHPSLGLIFRIVNNWGPTAHARPVDAHEPLGGFWITARTFDRICGGRDGEVFAFSGFEGFKVRELDFFA